MILNILLLFFSLASVILYIGYYQLVWVYKKFLIAFFIRHSGSKKFI